MGERIKFGKFVFSSIAAFAIGTLPVRGWGADSGTPAASDKPTAGEEPAAAGMQWTLAPLRWRWNGDSSYTIMRTFNSNGDSHQSSATTSRLGANGNTYIWQPWFATLAGAVNVGISTNTNDDSRTRSMNLSGNGRVALFPQSRFPFEAFFEKSDQNSRGDSLSVATSTQRFGATQRYRSRAGDMDGAASYQRHVSTSPAGNDVTNVFVLEGGKRIENQNFRASANYTNNNAPAAGQSSSVFNSALTHGYRPSEFLSVDNLVNYSRSHFQASQTSVDTGYLQMSSSAFWRDEDRPLTVSGGARMFSLSSGGTATAKSTSLAANIAANYQYDDYWRLSGTANYDSQGGLSSSQSVGYSYSGTPRRVWDMGYLWSVNASGTNTLGATNGQNLNAGFSHSLQKAVPSLFGAPVNVSLTEGLAGGISKTSGGNTSSSSSSSSSSSANTRVSMSHAASASWAQQAQASTTAVSMSVSDSRNLVGDTNAFQMFSAQLNKSARLSRSSSWTGNLTFQVSNQEKGGSTTSSNGSLTYNHTRLFGVPRLVFSSQYSAAQASSQGSAQTLNHTWDNRVRYTIGKTELELRGEISVVDAKNQGLIYFNLKRILGN